MQKFYLAEPFLLHQTPKNTPFFGIFISIISFSEPLHALTKTVYTVLSPVNGYRNLIPTAKNPYLVRRCPPTRFLLM